MSYEPSFIAQTAYYNELYDTSYGYLSISIIQDSKKIATTYTIQAFDQTFALIGGMAGFIYAIISLVIGSYQAFSF